ncbi:MAG TPA: D-2-hydroxyacid dehydrogenase [Verrucomicrobiales bacterium]|jgi:phosphoglycerate dehydrogenase-like enzyme|nr:D-2-hydroxyacid dehydrogenase [Verrucomicrobiales bacterium]
MSRLRIFVDLAIPPDVMPVLLEGAAGHDLMFPVAAASSVLNNGEIDPQFATADIAFGQPAVKAIENAPALKWVHVSSSGITRYDTPEFRKLAREKGLALSNSASVHQESCATQALCFMLAQARRLPLALKTRAESGSEAWWHIRGTSVPLRGQTILILGYGAIGRRLTEMLRPFGMKTMAYRRTARGDEGVPVITQEGLGKALAEADHVMNILPDSTETRGFFDAARFTAIKPGAVFYNIGRGTTMDQMALVETLRSGHLAAAWLDVTDPEPLPDDHPLWTTPECFITPHVAGGHVDETGALVRHFINNLQRFVQNQPLADRVM